MSSIKIAIIGCGAVTENGYLPSIAQLPQFKIIALVDKNLPRAKNLAEKYSVPNFFDDYNQLFDLVDAVIIALPHFLHAPVSVEFLKRGKHVLVEKPMAITIEECDRMIGAAEEGKAILAVGLMRRFLPSHQFVKKIIDNGVLGKIISFDIQEGFVYNWPVASDFFFKKETSGGGVLIDTGAHTIDSLLWWFGDIASFEYADDNYGGVEANCEINLQMTSGTTGFVRLSRTADLRNTAIIRGEKCTVEIALHSGRVTIFNDGSNVQLKGEVIECEKSIQTTDLVDLLKMQLVDWNQAITGARKLQVTLESAKKSIETISKFYRSRKELQFPWDDFDSIEKIPETEFKGKKIFVTGGTGFIGGRLTEILTRKYAAEVNVLVRNFTNVSRLARYPVKMFPGDILDYDSVKTAMQGCEIVFHCAYGKTGTESQQRKETLEGTENVLKAALELSVKRVVYLSTVSVYGVPKGVYLDESNLFQYSDDNYGNAKIDAEKVVRDFFIKYHLPVATVQPTIVYGPYAGPWTLNVVTQLKKGKIILVNGGTGICNAIYIDDVIQAILLAAIVEDAIGESFLISGEDLITWKEFFSSFEKIMGFNSTIKMNFDEIRKFNQYYKKEHNSFSQIKSLLHRNPQLITGFFTLPLTNALIKPLLFFIPRSVIVNLRTCLIGSRSSSNASSSESIKETIPLTNYQIYFFNSHTRVKIDKAKEKLGFSPRYRFNTGMELVRSWLRHSNLIIQKGDKF